MEFIQCGRNDKYPEEIKTWRIGEEIPEWLSDVSKITMDDFGDIDLVTRKTSLGGIEIIESGNSNAVLISTKSEEDYICFGDNKFFSLSPIQLSLLYEEKRNKKKR